jgi:sensor histidine kinase YesM
LKLLTRFSEWFFNTICISDQNGTLIPIVVPEKFTRIHKPVFEKGFFLQFSFLILATSIVSGILFYEIISGVHDQVVQMAFDILPNKYEIQYFLLYQSSVFSNIIIGTLSLQVFAYFLLAMSLYKKVSTPAFGIFATMRSFVKGRYDSRVHLIGYSYLRPQCRKLNKYLAEVQKSLHKADNNNIQD